MKTHLIAQVLLISAAFSSVSLAASPKKSENKSSNPSAIVNEANTKAAPDKSSESAFYQITVKDIHGKDFPLSSLKNKVVLIVNTASQCGYTPQLKTLQSLYEKYQSQGFIVLGFPSGDFKQELASAEEVEKFAQNNFKITFPLMEKAAVRGSDKQPVYQFLTNGGGIQMFEDVAWNFEKFLIDRKGQQVGRWRSPTKPDSAEITKAIESALSQK